MRRIGLILLFVAGCGGGGGNPVAGLAALLKLFGGFPTQTSLEGALVEWSFAGGQPTKWSSTTLGVPDKVPNGRTDILRVGVSGSYLDASDLSTFGSNFPEGNGAIGTRVSASPGMGLLPDFYMFFFMQLRENFPVGVDNRFFQYAFVFDQDADPANNFVASAPFDEDFFKGTDRWAQLLKTPGNPWTLGLTDARGGGFVTEISRAIALACDDILLMMFPMSEFPLLRFYPPYRGTAFEHGGDFGQNAPHDWFGSDRPFRNDPLARLPTSTLLRLAPQVSLDVHYGAVEPGFFGNIGLNLDPLSTYSFNPLVTGQVKSQHTSNIVADGGLLGGFMASRKLIAMDLGVGFPFTELAGATPTSADHADYPTPPGERIFSLNPADLHSFSPPLQRNYNTPILTGGLPVVGSLFGKRLNPTTLAPIVADIDGDAGRSRFALPEIYAYNGQRYLTQFLDRVSDVGNMETSFQTRIQSQFPTVANAWTGPILDVQPFINADRSVRLTLRLDTRGFTVVSPETINVQGQSFGLRVPVLESRFTTTTITVPAGESILLGGIQNSGDPSVTEDLPLLRDIPVLDKLFSPSQKINDARHLLVIITPRIVEYDD